jgi:Na+-driven multidrug efflux pump
VKSIFYCFLTFYLFILLMVRVLVAYYIYKRQNRSAKFWLRQFVMSDVLFHKFNRQ